MRVLLLTMSVVVLIAGCAFAQAPEMDHSFTEIEAKSLFEASGYSNVRGLHKAFGYWHATATKNGKSLNLGLDVQGHVGIE
jgi:hypothetical protein